MKISDRQIDMLWSEFEMVQNKIIEFDKIIFQIKTWSITLFSATIWFYFEKNNHYLFLFLITFAPFFFWFLDYRYKCFQNYSITRGLLIQGFFNSPKNADLFEKKISGYDEYRIPDIDVRGKYNEDWEKIILEKRAQSRLLFKIHTCSFYLIQIAFGICLFILRNCHVIK
jgi:hypothetical protein